MRPSGRLQTMTKPLSDQRPEANRIARASVSPHERNSNLWGTLRFDGTARRTRTHRLVRRADFEDVLQANQPARKSVASRSASECSGSIGRGLGEHDAFGGWMPTAPPVRP